MSNLVVFPYNGSDIRYNVASQMFCATDMVKAQADKDKTKQIGHFLARNDAKTLISALKTRYRDSDNGVIEVIQGGNDKAKQGTWMCETLAMDFAMWLDVDFRITCLEWLNDLRNNKIPNKALEEPKKRTIRRVDYKSLADMLYDIIQMDGGEKGKSLAQKLYEGTLC